jgi:acetyltransferase-like isoleucine patch superfamily enzyme
MLFKLIRRWPRLKARLFTALARPSFFAIGKGTVLLLPVRTGGERWIALGANVYVGADSWLQYVPNGMPPEGAAIRIGDRVQISGHCSITACENVVIEDDVLIARYVHISDHSHGFEDRLNPVKDQGVTSPLPVLIKRGAWIGHGVVICPGVTVGRNSVIGANSVVRSNIPDGSVAVGAPARVIRRERQN